MPINGLPGGCKPPQPTWPTKPSSVPCPVVSGRADPLSRFDYTQQVFARMAAHAKEVILP